MDLTFAVNHMTAPNMGYNELLQLASSLGAKGVEFRNDFSHRELFDGDAPEDVRRSAQEVGVPILALSEVKMFNRWSSEKALEAQALMETAARAGIPAISLIPANDGQALGEEERLANLCEALGALKPMLERFDLIGNVEPLGFSTSSVRYKSEVVDAIEAVQGRGRFMLVHDTFHHALSGDQDIYPAHTGIVHISGVANPNAAIDALTDADRVLVDANDRLGNLEQIRRFQAAGWTGPYSFEPFAKEIHELDDPEDALRTSINFINASLGKEAA